jgi:hypothetical protein
MHYPEMSMINKTPTGMIKNVTCETKFGGANSICFSKYTKWT